MEHEDGLMSVSRAERACDAMTAGCTLVVRASDEPPGRDCARRAVLQSCHVGGMVPVRGVVVDDHRQGHRHGEQRQSGTAAPVDEQPSDDCARHREAADGELERAVRSNSTGTGALSAFSCPLLEARAAP